LISSELDDRITRENISSEEKLLAEREVLALQQSITYSLNELLSEFIVLWNKENHYEEKGNLNMEIDMNIQDFLKYSLNMQLHNYIAEVQ